MEKQDLVYQKAQEDLHKKYQIDNLRSEGKLTPGILQKYLAASSEVVSKLYPRKVFESDLKAHRTAMDALEEKYGLTYAYDSVREVKLFNHDGDELLINDGVKLISEAIVDLEERGFDVKCLARSLYKIFCVGMYFYDYLTSREEWEQRPYDFRAPDSVQIFNENIRPRIARMALQD
jgi:hypothetical protein